jgi:hypothetical protein
MTDRIDYKITMSAQAFNFKGPEQEAKVARYKSFKQEFVRWTQSSVQEVKGLPNKRNPYIVSGITDAFNQMYGLYNKIGIFDGEYGYHNLAMPDKITTDFREADAIILSHPFSGDGKCSLDKLKEANSYGVPIFIDCAFFGICSGISFDFKPYKNVHSVCFSLSKAFGSGYNRVGLLFTKDAFPCTVYEQWQYPLMASAEFHYNKLSLIGPDDLPKKHKQTQERVCRKLGLIPSPTVIFGLDYSDRYAMFKRGDTNRVCITKHLEK